MVSTSNVSNFRWVDGALRMGLLGLAVVDAQSKVNTAEAYALAEDPNYLGERTGKTCGDLFPTLYNDDTDGTRYGRARSDAQVLIYTYYASIMRAADRTATADTPLAKYVDALFRLKWSYHQFCMFTNLAESQFP